ncbi:MAG: glutamine-hydrolyzing carbamoyl-phosphate synthase small subunit [Verrucomicrobiia bacterium]
MKALLALEDGSVFRGESFGGSGSFEGEVCFNTSMTGYQEILTDPSYKGQMVAMTYPEIGNYGISPEDEESYRPHVGGLIVRELSPVASSWRSRERLEDYLARHGILGIRGVDTRALTKRLRVVGAMKGYLTTEELSDGAAVERARAWPGLVGVDYVKEVTHREGFEWDESGEKSRHWRDGHELGRDPEAGRVEPVRHRIVAFDFGMKYNILRSLRRHGFGVRVVPATTSAEEVLALNPDGVFLSNGPGDPAALDYAHRAVRGLLGKKPLFGICLGHQVLGHALGGRTFKLKFGHRGGNQPVQDRATGRVAITSQNHGFAVDPDSLPRGEVEVSHVNLNDGTCEGLRHREVPAFSVQYHPEAAPGPHDADYFFGEFRKLIDSIQ